MRIGNEFRWFSRELDSSEKARKKLQAECDGWSSKELQLTIDLDQRKKTLEVLKVQIHDLEEERHRNLCKISSLSKMLNHQPGIPQTQIRRFIAERFGNVVTCGFFKFFHLLVHVYNISRRIINRVREFPPHSFHNASFLVVQLHKNCSNYPRTVLLALTRRSMKQLIYLK